MCHYLWTLGTNKNVWSCRRDASAVLSHTNTTLGIPGSAANQLSKYQGECLCTMKLVLMTFGDIFKALAVSTLLTTSQPDKTRSKYGKLLGCSHMGRGGAKIAISLLDNVASKSLYSAINSQITKLPAPLMNTPRCQRGINDTDWLPLECTMPLESSLWLKTWLDDQISMLIRYELDEWENCFLEVMRQAGQGVFPIFLFIE